MDSSTSPVKRYVFDLDDTLFETRSLVVEAYRRAGVEMPPDAWGKPAHAWLPDLVSVGHWKWVHEKKQVYYDRLLRESPRPRTTACRAMIELALCGCTTYVLTGASRVAAVTLLAGLQSYHYRLLGYGSDLERKLAIVRNLGTMDTVYVDDDYISCDAMEEIGCSVVRYSFDLTKEEVMRPWLERSSLRRDAVND